MMNQTTTRALRVYKHHSNKSVLRVLWVAALRVFVFYCTTRECVEMGEQALDKTWPTIQRAYEVAAPASVPFADTGIALSGIIVVSIFLLALLGVTVLGVVWKTLFGRFIWGVLLALMFSICAAHMYVWVDSYKEPRFDPNAPNIMGAVISYCVGFVARLIVLEMMLVLLYFFNDSNKIAKILLICFGVAALLGVIAVIAYIFGSGLYFDLETHMGSARLDAKSWHTLWIFVPNLVLACGCLVAACLLCAFFAIGLKNDDSQTDLVTKAVKRALFVSIALVATSILSVGISIAELPSFSLYSQVLFLGIGVIGVEALFGICLSLLILNSWYTSMQMAKVAEEKASLLKRDDASNEAAVPLLYSNY